MYAWPVHSASRAQSNSQDDHTPPAVSLKKPSELYPSFSPLILPTPYPQHSETSTCPELLDHDGISSNTEGLFTFPNPQNDLTRHTTINNTDWVPSMMGDNSAVGQMNTRNPVYFNSPYDPQSRTAIIQEWPFNLLHNRYSSNAVVTDAASTSTQRAANCFVNPTHFNINTGKYFFLMMFLLVSNWYSGATHTATQRRDLHYSTDITTPSSLSNMLSPYGVGFNADGTDTDFDRQTNFSLPFSTNESTDQAFISTTLRRSSPYERESQRRHQESTQAEEYNMYQCTEFDCAETFQFRSGWERHELAVHKFNDTEWFCMFDNNCQNRHHNFRRKDLLKQHVLQVHITNMNKDQEKAYKTPDSWAIKKDASEWKQRSLWCGFCAKFFSSVPSRMDHVSTHFSNGCNMKHWQHLPKDE